MISITPTALIDLLLAIDICPVEISGLGEIELRGEEKRITELFVLPQRCSEAHTEFDPEGHHRFLEGLERGATNTKRLWWHSHVYMRARFSMIDETNIWRFGKNTPQDCNPWLISIVGNKYHRLGVRLDTFWPERTVRRGFSLNLLENPTQDELKSLYQERRARMEKLVQEMVTIEPEIDPDLKEDFDD